MGRSTNGYSQAWTGSAADGASSVSVSVHSGSQSGVELSRLGGLAMGTNEDGLPTLPLKMLLWYVLWASHIKSGASMVAGKLLRLSFVLSVLVFSTSVIIRAVQGTLPITAEGIMLLACYVIATTVNSTLEVSFVVVASLDYHRRY